MRPSSNQISDNESRHVEFLAVSSYTLYGVRGCCTPKMSIERTGAVSGYKSHKEINFESKQTLSALLADFRYYRILNGSTQVNSTEINSMPVPDKHTIVEMGKELRGNELSTEVCDRIVSAWIN